MKNYSLTTEILKFEKERTRFWFTAFVVSVAVGVLSHLVKKGGA